MRFRTAKALQAPRIRVLGMLLLVALTLGPLPTGAFAEDEPTPEEMLRVARAELEKARASNHRPGEAFWLQDMALALYLLGRLDEARKAYQESVEIYEALDDAEGAGISLAGLAELLNRQGQYLEALHTAERSVHALEKAKVADMLPAALNALANACFRMGLHRRAIGAMEKSLALAPENAAWYRPSAQVNLAALYWQVGEFPRAIRLAERALEGANRMDDPYIQSKALSTLGNIHSVLGDTETSIDFLTRCLELQRKISDLRGAAGTLINLAAAYHEAEDFENAERQYQEGIEAARAIGHHLWLANALHNLGVLHASMGRLEEAAKQLEAARKLRTDMRDQEGALRSRRMIAGLQSGDLDAALEETQGILEEAQALASPDLLAGCWLDVGRVRMARGEAQDALEAAHESVTASRPILGGLAQEHGAAVRERYSDAFVLGTAAAVELKSMKDVAYFLEEGRAGTLLEALGGREAIRGVAIPPALLEAEALARLNQAQARQRFADAKRSGKRKATRLRKAEVESANRELALVIDRIQREAKAGAALVYPRAASLDEMRERLGPDEGLVVFGALGDELIALVVTKEDAPRLARLGATSEIAERVQKLDLVDTETKPKRAIDSLRRRVISPLKLKRQTKRVLVSVQGVLSYVPFALLLPKREVVYVPSGSTYVLLRDTPAVNGEKVLALGDPAYPSGTARLLGSREEVETIGDVVLLGAKSTEADLFAALSKATSWRSVHLACHGLVHPERASLSSLALAPDAENDGNLTSLDVSRHRVPADLVVLSACESGRGKVYRAEGMVGLARAFMFAGAPRVICSLWKVDDNATQALMIKFYELWNPKDGSKGLGAAAALKKAQEHVRDHPDHDWDHPYYWAAWVLWGLP